MVLGIDIGPGDVKTSDSVRVFLRHGMIGSRGKRKESTETRSLLWCLYVDNKVSPKSSEVDGNESS